MSAKRPLSAAMTMLAGAITPDEVFAGCDALLREEFPVFHTLLALPSMGMAPHFFRSTQPAQDIEARFARIAELAPLGDVLRSGKRIKVSRMSDIFSLENPRHRAFYDEIMRPAGWRYSAAMLFWSRREGFLGQLSFVHTAEQGDITADETRRLAELHPFVNAAIRRLMAGETSRARETGILRVVDSLPVPLVVVGWDLRLQYSNHAGREALKVWTHGQARARGHPAKASLPRALAEICGSLKDEAERMLKRGDPRAFALERSVDHPREPGIHCKVGIIDPRTGPAMQPVFRVELALPQASESGVARAYSLVSRLSPAESQVARLAGHGHHNSAIAGQLGVSESTVRTHLRHVFRKIGINNRAQLAPIYHSLNGDSPTGDAVPPFAGNGRKSRAAGESDCGSGRIAR